MPFFSIQRVFLSEIPKTTPSLDLNGRDHAYVKLAFLRPNPFPGRLRCVDAVVEDVPQASNDGQLNLVDWATRVRERATKVCGRHRTIQTPTALEGRVEVSRDCGTTEAREHQRAILCECHDLVDISFFGNGKFARDGTWRAYDTGSIPGQASPSLIVRTPGCIPTLILPSISDA